MSTQDGKRPIRVLVAKAGLDGHDRGAKVVAAGLRDAGFEVIYTGLRQTPEMIVEAALQEDVDCVGLSVHSGAHMTVFPRVLALLREQGADDILLTGGGIIPDADVAALQALGVGLLFGPGTPLSEVADYIRSTVRVTGDSSMATAEPLVATTPSPFLTEDHLEIRSLIRDFSVNEVAPLARKLDEEKLFPHETVAKLAELGFMGVPYPEEYGGAGLDYMTYSIVIEELSRVCGTTGITVAAHTSLGTGPIFHFGTEEQKRKWVPRCASGEILAAFALTEPEAGSDAKATRTIAVDGGDHWLVNGAKLYCTNGSHAGVIVFTARTGGDVGDASKISAFLVEKDAPGLVYGKLEDKLGIRGSDTREFFLEDCKIPKENRLGEPGQGFGAFMKTLEGGRISIGAMGLGLAQGALDIALPYAQERRQFGKRLIDMQAIGRKLADMAMEIQAARNLVYEAAWRKDHGLPFARHASFAKLFASEVAMRAADSAVQILGGTGYTREAPAERILRDAKLCEIGEGTSEIQRLVITRLLDKEGLDV